MGLVVKARNVRWRSKKGALILLAGAALIITGGTVTKALLLGGSATPVSSSDIELQRGLVGWWKLDGNAKDYTPYGDDGTISGATPTLDRKGTTNGAMNFNGTSNYIRAATLSNVPSSTMTLCAWLKTSSATLQIIMEQGRSPTDANTEYQFTVSAAGRLGFWDYTSGYGFNGAGGATVVSDGQWHLACFTKNNTAGTFYVDGIADGTLTAALNATYSSNDFVIGEDYRASSGFFNGSMDDVRIYNRALSVAEVSALYNEHDAVLSLGTGDNGLIGRWKLDGNAKDSTPYGDNGTVSGATYTADRAGTPSGAMTFNGTSDYVYAKIGGGTYFGNNNPLTASAWVYVSSSANGPVFGVAQTPPSSGWNMPFLSVKGSTVYGHIWQVNSNTPLSYTTTVNQWHMLTITYTPGTEVFYVDGQQVATGSGTYSPSHATDYFTTYVGGTKPAGVSSYLNTPIDDVRAYSRALSANEVANIYNSYDAAIGVGGAPGAAGSGVQLSRGLVGSWGFNGNAEDSTPYGNNGVFMDNAGATAADPYGRANEALSLDGTGDYVDLGIVPSLTPPSITLSAWVKTSNLNQNSGWSGIITNMPSWGTGFSLQIGTTQHIAAMISGSYLETSWTPLANTWYHVVATHDASTNSNVLYVNGNQEATSTHAVSYVANARTIIGAFYTTGPGDLLKGSIDNVRIYNRVLNPAEVTALYNLKY